MAVFEGSGVGYAVGDTVGGRLVTVEVGGCSVKVGGGGVIVGVGKPVSSLQARLESRINKTITGSVFLVIRFYR